MRPTDPDAQLHQLADQAWRDPAQVVSQWQDAAAVDPRLLQCEASGRFWEVLAGSGSTLLVTREYEHLIFALAVVDGRPHVTYLPMPHPSGLAVDLEHGRVHVASTRNPNQVYELAPTAGVLPRRDLPAEPPDDRPLVPVASRTYPGCLYIHDLAFVGGALHGNAVGLNAVVKLCQHGGYDPVWWPRCVDRGGRPLDDRNYLQLNSIAAGADLAGSFFTASTDRVSRRRPGHASFAVDRRGVLFSGASGEPVARGLTRPHSARFFDDRVWLDNSGYGEVGFVGGDAFQSVARLPGWTRGLCFQDSIGFVGTSRVLPRFSLYAPGLDLAASTCAIHALDTTSGAVLGSLAWPHGNQIFAVEALPSRLTSGLPFPADRRRSHERERRLFYAFQTAI